MAEGLGHVTDTVEAFTVTIAINLDYGPAWFNLGGSRWNARDIPNAAVIWAQAARRFPTHVLAKEVPIRCIREKRPRGVSDK